MYCTLRCDQAPQPLLIKRCRECICHCWYCFGSDMDVALDFEFALSWGTDLLDKPCRCMVCEFDGDGLGLTIFKVKWMV